MYQRGKRFSPPAGFWVSEPKSLLVIAGAGILIGALCVFGSVVVWPYLSMVAGSASAYAPPCARLCGLGLFSAVLLLAAGCAIAWFDKEYSFLRTLLALYGLEVVVLIVGMAVGGVQFVSVPEAGALGGMISFCLGALAALLMAALPTVCAAGVVHALHGAAAFWLSRR